MVHCPCSTKKKFHPDENYAIGNRLPKAQQPSLSASSTQLIAYLLDSCIESPLSLQVVGTAISLSGNKENQTRSERAQYLSTFIYAPPFSHPIVLRFFLSFFSFFWLPLTNFSSFGRLNSKQIAPFPAGNGSSYISKTRVFRRRLARLALGGIIASHRGDIRKCMPSIGAGGCIY